MSAAVPAEAKVTDSRFSDAKFEVATFVVLQASKDKRLEKTAFLWVYQTRLGSLLKKRDPSAKEVAELRRLCREMHRAAVTLQGRGFDGYGIELANGTGDTSNLSPQRRVVFFFWDKGACKTSPSRGKIN